MRLSKSICALLFVSSKNAIAPAAGVNLLRRNLIINLISHRIRLFVPIVAVVLSASEPQASADSRKFAYTYEAITEANGNGKNGNVG